MLNSSRKIGASKEQVKRENEETQNSAAFSSTAYEDDDMLS
jgi:hypothetical protein